MRYVVGLILVVCATVPARADAGLPNFGARPQMAQHFAVFEGLDQYPDYVFFLAPGGVRVTPGAAIHLNSGARLVAVPKAVVQGVDGWSPQWNTAPPAGVLRSPVLHEFPRPIVSYHRPSVTTHFHVEPSGGDLKCIRGQEDVIVPPDDRPSVWMVLGGICGGLILTAVIVVGGLVWIIRRVTAKRQAAR
jgi:hypothetical protein